MNICRELFAKVPKDYMSQSIYFVKKYLYPPFKPLKAGDQVKDFTLNDHDGKPHSIMEYAGKGKYLLLESARKACTGEVLDRPKEYLKELHKNMPISLMSLPLQSVQRKCLMIRNSHVKIGWSSV